MKSRNAGLRICIAASIGVLTPVRCLAHNCSDPTDCYTTAAALLVALLGIAFLVAAPLILAALMEEGALFGALAEEGELTALAAEGEEFGALETPAEIAEEAQLRGGYNADSWTNTTFEPGTQVVQGAPGGGNYFTSLEEFQNSNGTLDAFNDGLQIKPNVEFAPRNGITVFEVTQTTPAAESTALANPGAGSGGWDQVFIPDTSNLTPLYSVPFGLP